MPEVKFKKSRVNVACACACLCAVTILPALFCLWDAVFWGTGRQLVEYDSRRTAVLAGALFAGLGLPLWWLFVRIMTLRFTDEGVWQSGVWGREFMAWGSVTHAEVAPPVLTLYGGERKMSINLLPYASPAQVVGFVRERVSLR